MNEVEVKILDVNLDSFKNTIRDLQGKLVHDRILYREMYFDASKHDVQFSSLRLRSQGDTCFLTMKFKVNKDVNFLTRKELEIEVSDFDTMQTMLQELGYEPYGLREKYRTEYKVGDVKVELDEYPEIPPYVEIEGNNQKSVEDFIKSLGFELKHTVHFSATEIIKQYGKDPSNLQFKKDLTK